LPDGPPLDKARLFLLPTELDKGQSRRIEREEIDRATAGLVIPDHKLNQQPGFIRKQRICHIQRRVAAVVSIELVSCLLLIPMP
jgi:hypothetical protein